VLGAAALSSCGTYNTVSDLVTSHVPERHSGRASIVVSLREQEAYLYQGKVLVATSRISSGREGYRTPTGHFRVIRKDIDTDEPLRNYVNDREVVKANVDSRRTTTAAFALCGASMPFSSSFPGYGLHQGYLPGVPAWLHPDLPENPPVLDAAKLGTSVTLRR
jgi:hypothetical protein